MTKIIPRKLSRLRAAAQIRDADDARVDLLDVLVEQERVVDARSPWKSPSRITSVPPRTSL
jgi:hypothetical protein